ncbi:MAG: hypothetical protein RL684_3312 [Pseudomonadota bacterium]|jgi:hypothetical protein
MTVAAQTPYSAQTGNGVATVYPFGFKLLLATDLQVYVDGALKTNITDYTVTGLGVDAGGSVTFVAAPANGSAVRLVRAMSQTRSTDYQQLGDFLTPVVNPDFDRSILLDQDQQLALSRSIHAPAYEPDANMQLPAKASRAGLVIMLDSNGDVTVGSPSATVYSADSIGLLFYDRTAQEISAGVTPTKYRYPPLDVRRYGAVGDWNGSTGTDNLAAFNNAFLVANVSGGTVNVPAGNFRVSAPIKMFHNTAFIGAGVGATTITKNTNATILTNLTSVLVCLTLTRPGDVSGNVNCILYVHDAIRALNVEIAHMTLTSGGTNPNTSVVDHAIVTSGMSSCHIHDLYISYVKIASYVSPVTFFGALEGIESYHCGQGPSIEAGTSLTIQNNYSSGCRNYGYYLRSVKYSTFCNNACDSTNQLSVEPAYTDRSVYSVSYEFNACYAMDCANNGAEQCFGTQVKIDSCINFKWNNNVILGPQSDYTGANQIAIFDIEAAAQNVEVQDNLISRGGVTALQGAASAAAHHDLYVNCAGGNKGFRFVNNWTCNNLFDNPSTVYGNNVPTYSSTLFQGAQLHGEFTPSASLLNATGVALTYGASNKGRYSIVNGWMYIDYYLHLATVAYTPTGAVFVSIEGLPLANQSASQGMMLCDFSSNVTWPTTESFWAAIDTTLKTGLIRNRTQSSTLRADAAAFASGSVDVKFHFTGQIYIGDVVNVI